MASAEWRFMAKVEIDPASGCWNWAAAKDTQGYGRFWGYGRLECSHRFGYELFVGPIPEGLQLDHLCRNPSCVNPKHLEPVTRAVNLARSPLIGSGASCKRGHPRTERDTYQHPNGSLVCRACERDRNRKRRPKENHK